MKSMCMIAVLAAASAFATDSAAVKPMFHPAGDSAKRPEIARPEFDTARPENARPEFDTARGPEMRRDSAVWATKVPDSIKAKIESRRADWEATRDTLRKMEPQDVKASVDSLKAVWEAKRAEQIAKLPADIQPKIAARVDSVAAKHAAVDAKIKAKKAEVRAKVEAKKAPAVPVAPVINP